MQQYVPYLFTLAGGLIAGFALGRWLGRAPGTRLVELETLLSERERETAELKNRHAQLEQDRVTGVTRLVELEKDLEFERDRHTEALKQIETARQEFEQQFAYLSRSALSENSRVFLELAQKTLAAHHETAKGELAQKEQAVSSLVKPLHETLEKLDKQVREIETKREGAYGTLTEQVRSLIESNRTLGTVTGNLDKALRSPNVRGRWGEVQLQRVVELAGMLEHCDFSRQETVTTETGRLRPDLVVTLPGGKSVVVDAKAPINAYLDALATDDPERQKTLLREHARLVRDHFRKLGEKQYWAQFACAPELAIMFVPGENFFGAALEHDATLFESGIENRVILASPTTLIALLRAFAYGWKLERMERNADEIGRRGRELYNRVTVLAGHFAGIRAGLNKAVEAHNSAVGSLEQSFLPAVRRFKDLGAGSEETIAELAPVETTTRVLNIAEARKGRSDDPEG